MAATYRPAPAVERIAKDLIARHHTDLHGVPIRYVFRSEAAKKAGKVVFGTARKISGLNAYLAADDVDEAGYGAEDFFVIEIAEDVWSVLDSDQRVALVDHELCHCSLEVTDDGTVKLGIRPHDLEEFRAVVERHGLWEPEVELFAEVLVAQPKLFDDLADTAARRLRDTMAEIGGGAIETVVDGETRRVDIPAAGS